MQLEVKLAVVLFLIAALGKCSDSIEDTEQEEHFVNDLFGGPEADEK